MIKSLQKQMLHSSREKQEIMGELFYESIVNIWMAY